MAAQDTSAARFKAMEDAAAVKVRSIPNIFELVFKKGATLLDMQGAWSYSGSDFNALRQAIRNSNAKVKILLQDTGATVECSLHEYCCVTAIFIGIKGVAKLDSKVKKCTDPSYADDTLKNLIKVTTMLNISIATLSNAFRDYASVGQVFNKNLPQDPYYCHDIDSLASMLAYGQTLTSNTAKIQAGFAPLSESAKNAFTAILSNLDTWAQVRDEIKADDSINISAALFDNAFTDNAKRHYYSTAKFAIMAVLAQVKVSFVNLAGGITLPKPKNKGLEKMGNWK